MQDLRLTLIQSDINWEDIGANLAMFEEKIWRISGPTDVIVLPEMFTTGFTMSAAPACGNDEHAHFQVDAPDC